MTKLQAKKSSQFCGDLQNKGLLHCRHTQLWALCPRVGNLPSMRILDTAAGSTKATRPNIPLQRFLPLHSAQILSNADAEHLVGQPDMQLLILCDWLVSFGGLVLATLLTVNSQS